MTLRLLLWSLGALVLVWGSFVWVGYQTGIHEADELTDGHLASVAALLLNMRAPEPVAVEQASQRAALPWLKQHDYQQSLTVVQWDAQGHTLFVSGTAPLPVFTQAQGFADLALGKDAAAWRSFSQWDSAHSRKVMVLLDLQERDDLARDIAGQMIEPGLWLLPVVALALGLALRRGLLPLYVLSNDVATLDERGAQRLASGAGWSELEPVVASINTLLDRQDAALARERRLTHEIAHELRTPLSSIVLQASALRGDLPTHAQVLALERIGQDALRAGHVLDQLFAMARTSRAELHGATAPLDWAAMARSVCADYAQQAWQQGDQIAVVGPPTLPVQGHAVLLEMALRNLLENALKHTPPQTHIEVQLGQGEAGAAWMRVCDDGGRERPPGEANSPPAASDDSLHLGHEIVRRVAELHGAQFGPVAAPPPFTMCYCLAFPALLADG